ncbi:uncharacterized protein BN745_00533 [Klebsiella variicola CAG:634]|nr:uncharacterized protein BN745_00533 [Klebsiella variicola CAG:634]
MLQYFARHTFRQFDGGVRTEQLDVTDVTAADIAFVSDRANDMTNFNAVITAYFNAVQFHLANITTLTLRTIFTIATRATVITVATTLETVITIAELTLRTHRRIRRDDQRTFALGHFQQRGGQRFHVQLFAFRRRLDFRQQRTVLVQIAAFQLLLNFSREFFQATFAQQFCVWQFYFRDRQFHRTFDVTQQATLAVLNEQQGAASTTRTTGTADTVNVRLGIHRDVIVNNQADTLNVQTTGRNVGSDQNVQTTVFQTLQRLLTQRLVHIAVQRGAVIAATLQRFSHFQGRVFGTHEDNRRIKVFRFQEAHQRFVFTHAVGRPVALADVRARGDAGLNAHFLRLFHKAAGNATNRFRHGGREQRGLMTFRDLRHNGFYVFDKAHAQHFIGFVQYQTAQFREIQRAALQVVQQTTWGTDNDLRTLTQSAQLHVITLAAVQGNHVYAAHMFREFRHCFSNLYRQFAGRRQHQNLWCSQLRINIVQQR